jgi:predicted permease
VNLGFDLEGLHVLTVESVSHGYTPAGTLALAVELERRAAALPGIEAVGVTDFLPLNLGNRTTVLAIPEREPVEGVGRFGTDHASVTPGYLTTMGIPLLRGRGFTDADREGSPAVMIINETLARLAWPAEDPVGKVIQLGSFTEGTPTEIIGVARDAKYRGLGDQGISMTYVPLAQSAPRSIALLARMQPGGGSPAPALRALFRELAPTLPLMVNAPYRDVVSVSLLPNRIATLVATLFGATGLLLATVGLYGVLAFTVQTRRREIGVRMALGAADQSIRRLVLRDGMRLTTIGLGLGLTAAAVIARLLGGLLYGLSHLDPVTYGLIIAVMLGTAWIAALGPIRRALRTEPLEVLRHG